MTRQRQNFISGTLSAQLLTAGTTMSSVRLADIGTITSGEVAVIVLDPLAINGDPEIIHVTAHTSGLNTATVLRAQEGTVARDHPSGTTWKHAPTADDYLVFPGATEAQLTALAGVAPAGTTARQSDGIRGEWRFTSTSRRRLSHELNLVRDFDGIGDGSDNSAVMRNMIAAAAAYSTSRKGVRLIVPEGEFLFSTDGANAYCLLIDTIHGLKLTVEGTLRITAASAAGKQLLRVANCNDFQLEGGLWRGPGTDGSDQGFGLLQFNACDGLRLMPEEVYDAECDGVAVSTSEDVTISGRYRNCSKGSVYANLSTDVDILPGTHIEEVGGHTVLGLPVGVGVQLSGCTRAKARGVIVRDGTGIGIYVNDIAGTPPKDCHVENCDVDNITNPTNVNVSSGYRFTNGNADKDTRSTLNNNKARRCGIYNYYVENHDGAKVSDNEGYESERSNFVFAAGNDYQIDDNKAVDTNSSETATQGAFHFLNACHRPRGRGNVAYATAAFVAAHPSGGSHTLRDSTTGTSDVYVSVELLGATDNNNANATLTVGISAYEQYWDQALVADRAVSLSTLGAAIGSRFRIVRKASATGAFNLNVGTGPLKALGIGEWCEVTYDGVAWYLSAYGAL